MIVFLCCLSSRCIRINGRPNIGLELTRREAALNEVCVQWPSAPYHNHSPKVPFRESRVLFLWVEPIGSNSLHAVGRWLCCMAPALPRQPQRSMACLCPMRTSWITLASRGRQSTTMTCTAIPMMSWITCILATVTHMDKCSTQHKSKFSHHSTTGGTHCVVYAAPLIHIVTNGTHCIAHAAVPLTLIVLCLWQRPALLMLAAALTQDVNNLCCMTSRN